MRKYPLALTLGTIAATALCFPKLALAADPVTVNIVLKAGVPVFEAPTDITVEENQEIKWVDKTGVAGIKHKLGPKPGTALFEGTSEFAGSMTHMFSSAAVMDYDCKLHATMVGKITVKKAEATDPKAEYKSEPKSEGTDK